MTLDPAVNLPTIVTITLAIIAFAAWLIRMEGRVTEAQKDVVDQQKMLSALEALVMLHKQQFHEYQLQAAKEFMTQAAFGEIKRELLSEINRMEGRLEAQIGRIE